MNLPSRLVLGFAAVVLASGCAAEAADPSEETPTAQAAALDVNPRGAVAELAAPVRPTEGLAQLEGPATLEALREPLRVSGKSGDFVTESKRLPR